MKNFFRKAVVIAACFIFPLVATAQLSLGIRGGPLFSRPSIGETDVSKYVSVRSLTGFSLGAVIQIRLTDNVALVAEPGFVRKGLDLVPEPNQFFTDWVFDLDYVELPVNLKMTFTPGTVQPYVTVGSAVAYKVSEDWTVTTRSTQQAADQADVFSRYDVTAVVGGGLSLAMFDPVSLVIDGRYSFGLNYIEKTGSGRIRSAEWRLGTGVVVRL